ASVQFNGTNITYNPRVSPTLNALARKEVVNDSFSYVISDNVGGYSTGAITIVVTGMNDRPIAAAYSYNIDEDTLLTVPATGVFANSVDPDVNGHFPDDNLRIR